MNEIELIEKIVNAWYAREIEASERFIEMVNEIEEDQGKDVIYYNHSDLNHLSFKETLERNFSEYVFKFDGGKWFVVSKI